MLCSLEVQALSKYLNVKIHSVMAAACLWLGTWCQVLFCLTMIVYVTLLGPGQASTT